MNLLEPSWGEEPVFNEPWEAQAFAMAVALHAKGVFTWAEWAECLGTSIKAEPALSYYEQWLAALEILLERKHALERGERLSRIEDWRQAAHRTPHGQPILLPSARDR